MYIGKEPIVGNFQKCDAISVVNGQAAYTLQVSSTNVTPESSQHCLVSLNGILQAPVTSFSVSGSTLTFASNLATGDVIDFVILLGNVLDLGVPSDDTVGAAQIKADLISGTTALTDAPADTDEFLVSDAGTLKRIDYSLIKGGGEWTKILHTTASDGANVAFNSTYMTTTYQDYKVVWSNVHCATDQTTFVLYASIDNGSNFLPMDYHNRGFKDDANVGSKDNNDGSTTAFQMHRNENIGNATGESMSGFIEIFDPSATDTRTHFLGRSGYNLGDAANAYDHGVIGGSTLSTSAVNYIKFQFASGNITSGEFTLYGRKIT